MYNITDKYKINHIFSLNLDEILQESSSDVFDGLKDGQIKILRFLAKKGPLNLKELGQLTSKYAIGFDRWGVKDRLKFLISYDYVTKIPINKKETKYGLTLKGIMACPSFIKLEDMYLISRYKQILMNYSKDNDKIESILSFIKNEITHLLYYNHVQGINWLKFRFLKTHLLQLRDYNTDKFYLHIEIDSNSLTNTEKSTFAQLSASHGHAYRLSRHFVGFIDENKVYREWIKKLKHESTFNPKMRTTIALFLYLRLWSELIDVYKKEMSLSQLVGTYLDFHRFDYRKPIVRMSQEDLEIISDKR
jgi:hypothetical protein